MPLAITDRTILMSGAGLVGATQAGLSSRLSAADARTLLGLSTSDSPTFAGLTLNGHLLFSPTNTYDIGNGTLDPRTVRAATSFVGPNTGDTGPWLRGAFTTSGIGIQDDRTTIWRYGTRIFSAGGEGICAYNVSPIGLSRTQTPQVYLYCEGDYTIGLTRPDGATYGTLNTAVVNHPSASLTLGNSTYGVTVPGKVQSGIDSSGGAAISYAINYANSGFGSYFNSPALIGGGSALAWVNSAGVHLMGGTYGYVWVGPNESGTGVEFAGHTALYPEAVNVLSQRKGTAGQAFRVYHTYTSSVNHERGKFAWESNVLKIGTEKGSSGGTARSLALQTDGTDRLTIDTAGAATFSGDISMSKTSAQGYIRAYYTDGVANAALSQTATGTRLESSSGYIDLRSASGLVYTYSTAADSQFRVYDQAGNFYTQTTTNSVGNGTISTSQAKLILAPNTFLELSPANGITQVYKAGSQSYFRVYNGAATRYLELTQNSVNNEISTSAGILILAPAEGSVYVAKSGYNSALDVYDSGLTKYTRITHDGTNGILSTSSGSLYLSPVDASTRLFTSGTASNLRVYSSAGSSYTELSTTGLIANTGAFTATISGALTLSTTTGDINLTPASGIVPIYKSGAQGRLYVWDSAVTKYTQVTHDGTNGLISASSGAMSVKGASGVVIVPGTGTGTDGLLRIYNSTNSYYTQSTHNGTDGVVSTSSGNLNLVPTGGTVAVTGGITASGNVSMQRTAAQGYVQAWDITTAKNTHIYHEGVCGHLGVSAGYLVMDNAVAFGGITSSFPALTWSGSTLKCRTADLASDAPFTCAGITASGAVLQTAEIINTPSGTTQTITLTSGNYQTLTLASSTGDVTVTLTVPATSGGGDILILQHATTSRDITWAASSGSIVWLGTEPTWNGDATSSYRKVSWRFNGTNTYLTSSGSS